jgi:hypothetical protein
MKWVLAERDLGICYQKSFPECRLLWSVVARPMGEWVQGGCNEQVSCEVTLSCVDQ